MKRTLASLLCVTLFFGMMTIFNLPAAGAAGGGYSGIGAYTAHLKADPATDTAPSDFGTTAANGKVWTDKSVTVNQDHFEVTLSALAQEYVSKSGTTSTASTAADVVMILDFSASMQQNTLTLDNETMPRTKAMVKAVNEALQIIMAANEKNRVTIHTYQSNSDGSAPVTKELLPLGHYTNDSWSANGVWSDSSGKYFTYSTYFTKNNRNENVEHGKMTTAAGLKKDGTTVSETSINTDLGTCTQHGIMKGTQALIDTISNETKSVDRKPYVLLFTDGAPGNATKNWYSVSSTSCDFSHSNEGSAALSALTILTATIMKDRLQTAYQTYNGRATDIEWFNIGLGVEDASKPAKTAYGTLFLNPSALVEDTTTYGSDIRTQISNYTSGKYSSYSAYGSDYDYTQICHLVDNGNKLEEAFTALADKVQEETKAITSPIISVEGATDDLTFIDTIGAGMSISGITLKPDSQTSITGVANGNTYSFAGYDTTVAVSGDATGRQVLTWNIPADEVAIFAFANRNDPTNGTYTAADPIRLTYRVEVTSPGSYAGETLYSNASATASFSIPNDNTYYYESAGGSLKSAPFADQAKSQNISGLTANHTAYSTTLIQNGAAITATLGNNGKLTPAIQLKKNASSATAEPNTTVDFLLNIQNVGATALTNVVVTDTLPEGMTYEQDSVQNATLSTAGQTLTFTVAEIPAGATVTVRYKARIAQNAVNNQAYTNTAAVTEIHNITVYAPVDESTTVTVKRMYQVIYEWTGAPNGAELPTDSGRYATGDSYTVDTKYTKQSKIENKDDFGNVTERWTFSGWEDPNSGVMGEENVTIPGVWSYESFAIPNYAVIYSWTGAPDNVTLPTDGNRYVCNQSYQVDTTYTKDLSIPTYDAYGNINGKYTFKGWNDPNSGTMGNADVTIPGEWEYESIPVPTYKVIYTWTGAPDNVTLPTDENTYVTNQPYTVDSTYTKETTVELKNEAGQVYGRYTFDGWEDPENGVMSEKDILIPGVWNYEEVSLPVAPTPDPIVPTPPAPDSLEPTPQPEDSTLEPNPDIGTTPGAGTTPDAETTPNPDTPPAPDKTPDSGTNPYTGDISLEAIFLLWLISSSALIVLGVFRKKFLK